MKHVTTYGFDASPRAYKGTMAAELPRVCQHDFIALPDGQLEHRMDGHVRATVPPEGLKAYADTWPDSAPVVKTLLGAEASAAKTRAPKKSTKRK